MHGEEIIIEKQADTGVITFELFASLAATEDAEEGVDAFLNKRSPKWKEK